MFKFNGNHTILEDLMETLTKQANPMGINGGGYPEKPSIQVRRALRAAEVLGSSSGIHGTTFEIHCNSSEIE